MKIIGIDPGPRESALVMIDEGCRVFCAADLANSLVSKWVGVWALEYQCCVAIEWIECFGMAVGREVFETVFHVGSFASTIDAHVRLIPRRDIKSHICNSQKAKDANIRAALIDKFGKVGTKKNPGPLFGISGHKWSALAVAVTAYDISVTNNESFFHSKELMSNANP